MGVAIVQGLLRAGYDPHEIAVCEVSERRRSELVASLPDVAVVGSMPACSEAVIAVKPSDVGEACASAAAAGAKRIISIAAGVRLDALQRAVGGAVRVVRAMPNTPATVGLGATAIATDSSCDEGDRDWAKRLLSSIGIVVELDESMIDAFTGLVGSGPAYVFYVAEALRDAALREGFDAEMASTLVARVFAGATALLEADPSSAEALRLRVTSPNGTTAAAVAELDTHKVREAIVSAVHAATKRSKEIGNA